MNEEELTDFLIFESNNVYIDYNENLFSFEKIKKEEKMVYLDLGNQEEKEEHQVTEEEKNINLSEEVL